MKRYVIIIFAMGIILSGCYKDLNPVEYSQLSTSDFPKNEEDVKGLVAGMYDPFNAKWQHLFDSKEAGYQTMSDLMGAIIDIRWGGRSRGFYGDYGFHEYHPQSEIVSIFFNNNYSHLNSGTLTLDRIDKAKGLVSEETLDKYKAEVRLARAWMSFIYYDWFGPMPIIPLEALKNPLVDQAFSRATSAEYVKYIEDDLKFAAEKLDYHQEVAGKFYKGLANMILLKLYMMEKDWVKAKSLAEELMKPEYGYSLSEEYNQPFSLFGGATNSEVIYYVPTERSALAGAFGWHTFGLHWLYPTKNPNIEKWGILMGTWHLYDSYQAGDKRTERMIAEFKGLNGVIYNRENPSDILHRGPFFMKYAEDPSQNGERSGVGVVVYRFADVLLAWAEAENNLKNGPTAECWNKLNLVRNRASAGVLDQADYNSFEKFNDLILAERLREFPVEGLSRQDLIRHGQFNAHTRNAYGPEASNLDRFIDSDGIHDKIGLDGRYNYKLPIPNSTIKDGKGLILQNPGYN